MSEPCCPVPLAPTYHAKIWGRPRGDMRLGEIWFRARPLLLKFIFTSEKLSVQVHPGDEYARRRENSAGKTECWYVIEAEPGAQLAVGFRRPINREEVLRSVRHQSIEQELNWIEVRRGDFIFVPWGTVHAIGPGLILCEVQEFSDVTYRLYDYGRPRELHLERALDVIRHHPAAGRMQPVPASSGGLAHDHLVACRYFVLERFVSTNDCCAAAAQAAAEAPFQVLVFLEGQGQIVGHGFCEAYAPEQMWRVPETVGSYRIKPRSETVWLRAYVPASLEEFRARLAQAGIAEQEVRRITIDDL